MKLICGEDGRRRMNSVRMLALLTLVLTLFARSAAAQTQDANSKSAEESADAETYQTLYLSSLAEQRDANDIQTDLRNMLPKAKLYYVSSQNAISMRGTPEDIKLAQKILSDIDRTKKTYRLTYTIREMDGGRQVGTQQFALVVASGGRTIFKQGNKVPIVTGRFNEETSNANSQVQYLDVGLNIDATLDAYSDGLRLHTKVEQSSIADEKSGIGAQDPVVRQTTLEGVSTLIQGKPVVLGSLDTPGSTRRQEIEVVSELVR
jgi:type II secretory pathway component GspD/PulD (secretin)